MTRIGLGSNIQSLRAQRQLNQRSAALGTIFERLASGQRINRASDDAAGLAVASSLDVGARVLTQAVRNANDGISLLNIADGALAQLTAITTRQIELATQAASGSLSQSQRRALQSESKALTREYNRILDSTSFNGQSLFSSVGDALRLQLGYGEDGGIEISRNKELARLVGTGEFSPSAWLSGASLVGDFDGDGLDDLLVQSGNNIQIRSNQGDAEFGSAVTIGTGIAEAVFDFDGDGRDDIIFRNGATLGILLSNGDGSFRQGDTFEMGMSIMDFTMADIDGDGTPDAIVTLPTFERHVVFSRNDGTFRSSTPIISASAYVDVNGDGIADAITKGITLDVAYGNGDGTFGASQAIHGIVDYFAFSDIDNDGYNDMILLAGGALTTYMNNGDGSFSKIMGKSVTYNSQTSLVMMDLNGDGHDDALVQHLSSAEVLFLDDNGMIIGTASATSFTSESSLIAADFNGDGATDIFQVNKNFEAGRLFISETQESVRAKDYNITSRSGALEALSSLNEQLQRLSLERGTLGALQSRVTAAATTILSTTENYRSAEGRIRNADVAVQSALLVREQILQQAGAAVLTQANLQPGLALLLLQPPTSEKE